MEILLPVAARWVPGHQKGSMIPIDPHNVKVRKKTNSGKESFFICSRKKDLLCPVTCVVKNDADFIIRFVITIFVNYVYHIIITRHHGDHNHDSCLVESMVKENVNRMLEACVENTTVPPCKAFQDLTKNVLEDQNTSGSGLNYLPTPR